MDIKNQSNHGNYLGILRRMTPEQRLLKAFELTEFSRQLFRQGLRNLHPKLSETEFHTLFLARLEKCHNQNY